MPPTAIATPDTPLHFEWTRSSHGVYVVVWMDVPNRPNLRPNHRPKWPDIDIAKAELEVQADSLKQEHGVMVATILIDASLR